MKVHHVRFDRSGSTLLKVIENAAAGDRIVLPEGRHEIDGIRLDHLEIGGAGDPSKVILRGSIEVAGTARISNLTLEAPHYRNALYLQTTGSSAEFSGVTLLADPTGKYPAIVCLEGSLHMRDCAVRGAASAPLVSIRDRGTLQATACMLAGLEVENAQARLHDTQAYRVTLASNARLDATGWLQLYAPEQTRSIILSGESVCTIQYLQLNDQLSEAFCEDSSLSIHYIDATLGGAPLDVWRHGHCLIEAPDGAIRITPVDDDNRPLTGGSEREIRWRAGDGRSFTEHVLPGLRQGDTLVLGAGDYHFDEDFVLGLDINIRGEADASQTRLVGALASIAGHSVRISGVTIQARQGCNAIRVSEDASVALDAVVLESASTGEFPAAFVAGGRLVMRSTTIDADASTITEGVHITGGGHLDAANSGLGWVKVFEGSTAVIDDCSAFQFWADESTVTGTLSIVENAAEQRGLAATAGSVVQLDSLSSNAPYLEAYVSSSTLRVIAMERPEGTETDVVTDDDAVVDIPRDRQKENTHAASENLVSADRDQAEGESPGSAGSHTDSAHGPDHGGDPLEHIEDLVGLESVKAKARSFARMAKFNRLRADQGFKNADATMHSLFLGNPGTGKTTVARLLGKALFRAGAIQQDIFVEVQRRDLVDEFIGGTAKRTQEVLERARGGMLFVDEAYALHSEGKNDFGQEAVDTLLTFMENHRDEIVIIFAGYADRMQDFLSMNPGLRSRVPNVFHFEDYTPQEIAEIGISTLHADDYAVDENAYRRAVPAYYRQTNDNSNGRWVRNLNQELIAMLAHRVMESMEATDGGDIDVQRITSADLNAVTGGSANDADKVSAVLEELDALVGLAPVKTWVRGLVNRAKVDRDRRELDGSISRPTYHMVFAGNPGTGKTTVANLVGRLFHALGLLQSPTVKTVERATLVGRHVGDTEALTTRAVDEAMGGVLFVDEAYQLSVDESPNDFGRQAIETLITRLENDRERFVAIFAGYTEPMENLLRANDGLRSRIPGYIEFPDYSPTEVAEIVVRRLRESWTFDEQAIASVAARRYAEAGDHSNGRWARNFVDRVENAQIDYLADRGIQGDELRTIPGEVIATL